MPTLTTLPYVTNTAAAKLAKLGILTVADLAALEPDDASALMRVTTPNVKNRTLSIIAHTCRPSQQAFATRNAEV